MGKQDIELLPCGRVPVKYLAIVNAFPGTYIRTSVAGGSVFHLVYSVL